MGSDRESNVHRHLPLSAKSAGRYHARVPAIEANDTRAAMDRSEWLSRRARRRDLATAAAAERSSVGRLLHAWAPAAREAANEALGGFAPVDGPGMGRLVAWVYDEPPATLPDAPEALVDATAIATVAARPTTAGERRGAALYLLARVGEELAAREAPERTVVDPARDERTRAAWSRMVRGEYDLRLVRELRSLYETTVRRAFRAVCDQLGLPRDTAERAGREAVEALEDLPFGPYLDVAARVAESAGPPVSELVALLAPAEREVAARAVRGGGPWAEAAARLGGAHPFTPERVQAGAHLHLLLRLRGSLEASDPAPRPTELPLWGVVTANLGRVRGRLRALVVRDPAALVARVLALPGLHRRVDGGLSRWAWDWAWREARGGFSFDRNLMRHPTCVEGPPDPPPPPPPARAAVRTFLLAAIAAGCWDRLDAWVEGGSTAELPDALYRLLARGRGALSDARDPALRGRYEGLRLHLDESRDDYARELEAVALRVVAAAPGRHRRRAVHEALGADWDGSVADLPGAADRVVERFSLYLSTTRSISGQGGEA